MKTENMLWKNNAYRYPVYHYFFSSMNSCNFARIPIEWSHSCPRAGFVKTERWRTTKQKQNKRFEDDIQWAKHISGSFYLYLSMTLNDILVSYRNKQVKEINFSRGSFHSKFWMMLSFYCVAIQIYFMCLKIIDTSTSTAKSNFEFCFFVVLITDVVATFVGGLDKLYVSFYQLTRSVARN